MPKLVAVCMSDCIGVSMGPKNLGTLGPHPLDGGVYEHDPPQVLPRQIWSLRSNRSLWALVWVPKMLGALGPAPLRRGRV